MRNYTCAEYVNTANLRRILRARKVDRDQLAQLKSLEKRLRAQGGDRHRLNFALPDPQVCVDDLFGRLIVITKSGSDGSVCPMAYDKLIIGRCAARPAERRSLRSLRLLLRLTPRHPTPPRSAPTTNPGMMRRAM